ncbi:hypothetical protein ASG76_01990 [Nocardioides sp. Soil774]|uniref:sugar transferase n=1 Tax=Nocardioides sp. Soil774 TaxID=1736408 RepID=UPI0006F67A95|nr:sugar transferase [Nocardioides sp. Soil774]KRE97510.1 hypothetical protein ASG76_01990 [Nocardioides sp. Soil774]
MTRRRDVAPREAASPDIVVRVSTARRVLDLLVASAMLVLSLPVLALAALLILLEDGGPVIFRQIRLGEGARPFTVYKLRTMRSSERGPAVTATDDPRITRVGTWLRRLSIDELPQLWQVLRGQMTLVGPRPESQELASRYVQPFRTVLLARPGLTGPAQLFYREASAVPPPGWTDTDAWYLSVLVPLRSQADLDYLADPTLARTLRYLALTGLFVTGLADLQRSVDAPGATAQGQAGSGT